MHRSHRAYLWLVLAASGLAAAWLLQRHLAALHLAYLGRFSVAPDAPVEFLMGPCELFMYRSSEALGGFLSFLAFRSSCPFAKTRRTAIRTKVPANAEQGPPARPGGPSAGGRRCRPRGPATGPGGRASPGFALSEKVELQPLVQGMPVERLVGEAREAFPVAGAVPPEPWSLEDEHAALRTLAVRFEDLSQDPDETDRVWRRLLTLRPRQFLFASLRLRSDLRERQAEVLAPLLRTLADETLAYETRVATADALLRRSRPRLLRPMGRHAPMALDLFVELVEELAARK